MNFDLIDLTATIATELITKDEYPWFALKNIDIWIKKYINNNMNFYHQIAEGVWIADKVLIDDNVRIMPPTIIGLGCHIRHNAYIRGRAIIGKNCIIGNATEVKNAIICDNVQLPHYNYVGDSILGRGVHLGAGAIISNYRLDHQNIKVKLPDGTKIDTGLPKFGAIVGDEAEVGCNSVINPGTIIDRRVKIRPLQSVTCWVSLSQANLVV